MKFRSTVLASTLTLLGAASLGAQAASEDLKIDNGTLATAQALGPLGSGGTINVFGLRGTVNFFGVSIVDNSDADYYSFTIGANQNITLRVDTPEGPVLKNDPMVGLYSADGKKLGVNDDDGPGLDSLLLPGKITLAPGEITLAPGTYFAAVSGYEDFDFNGQPDSGPNGQFSTNFQYNLQISSAPAPVPVPAAGWLLGSALLGLARRRKTA